MMQVKCESLVLCEWLQVELPAENHKYFIFGSLEFHRARSLPAWVDEFCSQCSSSRIILVTKKDD
jgi:hypothetical protein